MKARIYWTYATRSLARGGQRTLLAVLCIAVGMLAIVSLQLVGNMVNTSLTGNIRDLNGGDLVFTDYQLTTDQLAYFAQLRAQGILSSYTAVASTQGSAVGAHPIARIDRILAVDPAHFPLAGAPTFTAPNNSALSHLLTGTSVVLTQDIAQQLGVSVGERFSLRLSDGSPASATVGGIITNTGLFQQPQILLAFNTYLSLRKATAPPIRYASVYADVPGHSASLAAQAQQQLLHHFSDGIVLTTGLLLQQNQQRVQDIRSFLNVVGLVALLIGGMGIINTMQVLLRRRRLEIAMLKTAGYRRRHLYALFGLEAGLIGLAGGVLGAALGVGVSLLVKPLFENAFSLTLPATIDPLTLGAGIAMGCITALIFGLLPIVQASQIRPSAVLRELPEGARTASRLSTALLGLLVIALFFGLALSILQDVTMALELVIGAALVLGLLSLLFTLAAWLISKAPVPESFHLGYVLIALLALLAAVGLTALVPAFGLLLLGMALLALASLLAPRAWKTTIKLALRNIGRQKARTATTQVALCIGVFGVGLILIVGQGLKAQYNLVGNAINATVGALPADEAAVQQQLQRTPGISRQERYISTGYVVVQVNGQAPAIPQQFGSGVMGYDLASGQVPAAPDIALEQGRLLTASDAGSNNVILDPEQTDPALQLKVGDTMTVEYTAKFGGPPPNAPQVTLTIVGFYTNHSAYAERAGNLITDNSVVTAIAPNTFSYLFTVHVDPQVADRVLTQVQAAVPGVWIHNYADLFAQVETYFNNLILMLEAIVLPAFLAGIIIIANAVALAMMERRRELGILKAVGLRSRGVLSGVLIEQGITGLTGGLLAMVFAVGVAGTLGKFSLQVDIGIPTPVVLGLVVSSAILCLLVTAGVAWSATRVRPLEVLRYE